MRKKQKILIGVDEAGRGALAGPVVAAAVAFKVFPLNFEKYKKICPQFFKNGYGDSKNLSSKKREEIFEILKNEKDLVFGIGKVGPKVIDKINIFFATKLAMKRAVINLQKKIKENKKPFLLIDGNFFLDLSFPQQSIIKGDKKVFLIKLASIIAKVKRDRMMISYHKKYPNYGFDKHKGYGTTLHLKNIQLYGISPIHRKSFSPISKLL